VILQGSLLDLPFGRIHMFVNPISNNLTSSVSVSIIIPILLSAKCFISIALPAICAYSKLCDIIGLVAFIGNNLRRFMYVNYSTEYRVTRTRARVTINAYRNGCGLFKTGAVNEAIE